MNRTTTLGTQRLALRSTCPSFTPSILIPVGVASSACLHFCPRHSCPVLPLLQNCPAPLIVRSKATRSLSVSDTRNGPPTPPHMLPFYSPSFSCCRDNYIHAQHTGQRRWAGHTMIIPVRCFTCGKVIGNMWEEWCDMLLKDMTEGEALDALGLERLCCRSQLLTHVPLVDKVYFERTHAHTHVHTHVPPLRTHSLTSTRSLGWLPRESKNKNARASSTPTAHARAVTRIPSLTSSPSHHHNRDEPPPPSRKTNTRAH